MEQSEIIEAFKLHFEAIYQTSCPSKDRISACLGSMQCRVTEQVNEMLFKDFTITIIEVAIHKMGPLKS